MEITTKKEIKHNRKFALSTLFDPLANIINRRGHKVGEKNNII